MRVFARRGARRNPLLLDTADGLDLRGLAMGAKLLEVFVLPTVTVTLHDVLVSTVTRELVAHEPVARGSKNRQRRMKNAKGTMTQKNPLRYSRSGLNTHRAHFIVAPSHSLKRGVVVTELSLAAQIVLPIIDSHSALPVVLDGVILNNVSQ